MPLSDKDVRASPKERDKAQVCLVQAAPEHALVVGREVEHPDVAPKGAHVVDHVGRARLAQGEVAGLVMALCDKLREGVYHKGIVLRRDGQLAVGVVAVALVVANHEVCLLDHLARIGEKLHALGRERDALVRAVEDLDAHLLLELADGGREGGLGDVVAVRYGVDRPALRDGDEIAQLLQAHASPPRAGRGTSCAPRTLPARSRA